MERAPVVTPVDTYPVRPVRRVSWGAVLAGTVVALMVMMLVNLLTLGIGLQAIDPASEAEPLAGVGTGATVGMIIANVLALFLGGWVAGRAAGEAGRLEGALHGLLTWGLVTLLSFWLLSTAASRLVGGVASAVGQGLTLVGQGVSALAPSAAQAVEDALESQGVTLDSMREEAAALIEQATAGEVQADEAATEAAQAAQDIAQNPQAAGRRLDQLITQVFGADPSDAVNRDSVVEALEQAGMAPAEAEQTVTNWEQTAEEARARIEAARQDLEEAAQAATDSVGSAAIWAFFGLLLGAVIAVVGSAAGRPRAVDGGRAPA